MLNILMVRPTFPLLVKKERCWSSCNWKCLCPIKSFEYLKKKKKNTERDKNKIKK